MFCRIVHSAKRGWKRIILCKLYLLKTRGKCVKIKQTVRTILLCGFLFAYTDATLAQITLSVKQQPVREVIKEIRKDQ